MCISYRWNCAYLRCFMFTSDTVIMCSSSVLVAFATWCHATPGFIHQRAGYASQETPWVLMPTTRGPVTKL